MKKIIIIAGDSWGYGEWPESDNHPMYHPGLAQYLVDDNYTVINLSKANGSNYTTWRRLDNFFAANKYCLNQIEKIFVFQTEWDRELSLNTQEILHLITKPAALFRGIGFMHIDPECKIDDQINLSTANALGSLMLSNFYQHLSRIGTKYNLVIDLLGGCTDVMWPDTFLENYPNVRVACQSISNLLVNDVPNIDQPVGTLFQKKSVINFIKKHLVGNQELSEFLNLITAGQLRIDLWHKNKDWFYPDGVHANREGHRKLYEFLKKNW